MDLFALDNDLLGALDRAVGGDLIAATEYMVRVVGAGHLDLMVGGVVGCGPPYALHVIALNESKELVLADVVLPVNEEIDEPTLRAVLQVYTRCLVERADREKRRLTLKGISFDNEDAQNRSAIEMPESRAATPRLSGRRRVRP